MSLYRCAACGSPNVVTDEQAGAVGFNYKKGMIGAVVLGAGGAAAGIESKKETVFKCPDCGLTLSAPMPEELKRVIDLGVMDADVRASLTAFDVHVSWDFLKKKYKNIESGAGDESLKLRAEQESNLRKLQLQTNQMLGEEIKKEFDAVVTAAELESKTEDHVEEMQSAWELASKDTLLQRKTFCEQETAKIAEVYDQDAAEIEARYEDAKEQVKQAKRQLQDEQSALEDKLSTLGIFKIAEKKNIKAQLEQIAHDLTQADHEQYSMEEQLKKDLKESQKKKDLSIQELEAQAASKYPLSESPKEAQEKLNRKIKWYKNAYSHDDLYRQIMELRKIVVVFIMEWMEKPISYMDEFNTFQDIDGLIFDSAASVSCELDLPKLGVVFRWLEEEGVITHEEIKRKKFYKLAD